MADLLIRNMKMPTSCANCEWSLLCKMDLGMSCYCSIAKKKEDIDIARKERMSFCPLFEIPPHGRLIDADVLVEDLERQCKEVFRIDAVSPDDYWITRNEAYNEALWKTWVESFDNYLKTRPTVIPADKDGET